MAQNTGAMSSANAKVEYSLDASTWVDISGSYTSVTPSGGDRVVVPLFTGAEDTPLIGQGKRNAQTITINIVYSETTGTPQGFEPLRTVHLSGAGVALRWSPTAYTAVNQKRYSTATNASGSTVVAVVPIINLTIPPLDPSSGTPLLAELSVMAPDILTEDHA
jgi:hypothetical protein